MIAVGSLSKGYCEIKEYLLIDLVLVCSLIDIIM